ncbi:hypothetical protein KC19_2G027500 [Ceratodon purpureus]|uniref:Cytoplasmic tRNA 2-thiolation protein 2 n=1 Tax=Ceratodon purpureus TaxID=3225 RepID=A0A8T0ISK2_CERPU|nr:hypothetical protein KC19_2G027500 [Ceratodon purpureus]
MACNSGQGCGSGEGCGTNSCASGSPCSREDDTVQLSSAVKPGICVKCKEEPTSEGFELCCTCLHTNLVSKFKTAVNKNSLVTPADHVLLALSGGPGSRVALEFLREIRLKAQTDLDASRDQGTRVFGLGVVFVDEAGAQSSSQNSEHNVEEISSIVVSENERPVPLHIVKLQDVFEDKDLRSSPGLDEDVGTRSPEERLQELLGNVEDVTGKEDLVSYLRMQVLQKVAKEHGYTKVVLGVCSSRIAARAIAATAKGQGFSFPADIQYVDSRWPVTVVLPLRDCLARELDVYCRLANLKTVSIENTSFSTDKSKSINEISQVFVSLLQEQNFSREYTITRTMGKLKPFDFNTPPVGPIEVALRRRKGIQTPTIAANEVPDLLCPICSAPLDTRDFMNGGAECSAELSNGGEVPFANDRDDVLGSSRFPDAFKSTCCPSCSFQIIPKKGIKAESMYKILPEVMKERAVTNIRDRQSWMRSRIQEYLLPDDQD